MRATCPPSLSTSSSSSSVSRVLPIPASPTIAIQWGRSSPCQIARTIAHSSSLPISGYSTVVATCLYAMGSIARWDGDRTTGRWPVAGNVPARIFATSSRVAAPGSTSSSARNVSRQIPNWTSAAPVSLFSASNPINWRCASSRHGFNASSRRTVAIAWGNSSRWVKLSVNRCSTSAICGPWSSFRPISRKIGAKIDRILLGTTVASWRLAETMTIAHLCFQPGLFAQRPRLKFSAQ